MNGAERFYRLLLRAYPAAFRAEFEREMVQAFRDLRRERRGGRVRFWAEVLFDIAKSAPPMRWPASRAPSREQRSTTEVIMKAVAIFAMLIGAAEAANALAEAWVGGIVLHGGSSLAGGAIAALAGALLAASAVALLRRTRRAVMLAQGAAAACVAVFGIVALVRPMFSVVSTLLGIGFPIVMLAFLQFRPKGPAAPSIA